ncbi:MAG: DNA mismatch repair protein MutS [Nitrospirota bacterium]
MSQSHPPMADELSPLMQQYHQLKQRYPGAILFFRVGDFYEMFDDDAVKGAQLLNIALTSRDKHKANPTPLCGVPAVAATGYIAKLIRAGQPVAICEQVEPHPGQTGLMAREVVRVITPGTILEPELLDPKQSTYVAALAQTGQSIGPITGIAWADLSTGQGWLSTTQSGRPQEAVAELLRRWSAKEIALPQHLIQQSSWQQALMEFRIVGRPPAEFDPENGRRQLLRHFRVESLAAWGGADEPAALGALGALLHYLEETQKQALPHLRAFRFHRPEHYMAIDPATQQHLELTERSSPAGHSRKESSATGSLLHAIDRTATAMGGRLLREWLLHPLLDPAQINERLDRVEAFCADEERRSSVRSALEPIGDLERIIGRISLNAATARDLIQLKHSIDQIPVIWKSLSEGESLLIELVAGWDELADLAQWIDAALVEAPPLALKEGGLIKPGYHAELDELREIGRDGKQWIARMEGEERQKTSIESLKIRYNQLFGYFIEVTKPNLPKVPPHYHRKQTMVNAERFITPELKALEAKVLGAEERSCRLEYELYEDLRAKVAAQAPRVQAMAERIARIDVLAALAESAALGRYQRPVVSDSLTIRITGGRHPVVEQALGPNRFVPNDLLLNDTDQRLIVITGPNMAGKSTYLRQAAHIVIMAQMGGFVPAQSAEIGVVDGIFTRIGATDDLVGGRSTFMVEMDETATILHRATPRSLVLLDEVGRGTSTYDGVSIAWAVAEHLHRAIGARTLFATHYHELTELSRQHEGIKAFHVSVREWNDEIIFLRTIVEGISDRSYGIQVARLAGLPDSVIATAKQVLARLESQAPPVSPSGDTVPNPQQPDLFEDSPLKQLAEELAALDPNNMTPMQALEKLINLVTLCRVLITQPGR